MLPTQLPAPPDVLGKKGQYPRQAKGSGPGWSRGQAAPYPPHEGCKGQPFLRAAVWLLRVPRVSDPLILLSSILSTGAECRDTMAWAATGGWGGGEEITQRGPTFYFRPPLPHAVRGWWQKSRLQCKSSKRKGPYSLFLLLQTALWTREGVHWISLLHVCSLS